MEVTGKLTVLRPLQ